MERNLFAYIWKNNRRDHFVVLAITLASLPFYLLSLDLPKRIINEAILGSAFESGNLLWLLRLPDAGEVMPVPWLCKVPLTQRWMKGHVSVT